MLKQQDVHCGAPQDSDVGVKVGVTYYHMGS